MDGFLDMLAVGADATLREAQSSLGIPLQRPGTVTAAGGEIVAVQVVGDAGTPVLTPAQNLTGWDLPIGQRVMIEYHPPHGAFVAGVIGIAQNFAARSAGYGRITTAGTTLTVQVPSVPTGTNLRIIGKAQNSAGTDVNLLLRFNADAGAGKYTSFAEIRGRNSAATAGIGAAGTSIFIGLHGNESTNRFTSFTVDVPDYASVLHKSVHGSYYTPGNLTTTTTVATIGGGWLDTAPITSVSIVANANNLAVGTFLQLEVTSTGV